MLAKRSINIENVNLENRSFFYIWIKRHSFIVVKAHTFGPPLILLSFLIEVSGSCVRHTSDWPRILGIQASDWSTPRRMSRAQSNGVTAGSVSFEL